MPVAHLLGKGIKHLCELFDSAPKIKPENLCIIGVRSYEPGEAALLNQLGVRVIFMDEVHERGMNAVLNEACEHAAKTTCGFGISIDMDSIDPADAPGVGCPEPGGIRGQALVSALQSIHYSKPLLGLELTEFNPLRDQNGITAALLADLMNSVMHAFSLLFGIDSDKERFFSESNPRIGA